MRVVGEDVTWSRSVFGAVDGGAVPTVARLRRWRAFCRRCATSTVRRNDGRCPSAPGLGGSTTRYRDRTPRSCWSSSTRFCRSRVAVTVPGGRPACGDPFDCASAARHADCRAHGVIQDEHRRRSGVCARTDRPPAFCRGEERHGGSVITTRGCAVTASRTSWLPWQSITLRFEVTPTPAATIRRAVVCPEDAQPQAGSRCPAEPQGCSELHNVELNDQRN